MRTTVTVLAAALCLAGSLACAGNSVTRRIKLLSVTFDLPTKLWVETEGVDGVDEIWAMPVKCETRYCLPVVMAWECRTNADPKCSDLRMLPPDESCSGTVAQAINHSTGLYETRWVCPHTNGTDQGGFSVFDLKAGKLVVSYLGGEADVSPGSFFDGIAKSIKEK